MIVLPWSGFWERNYFAQIWPALEPFLTDPSIRGGVTGLGVINVMAAVSELLPVITSRRRHHAPPAGHAQPRYPQGADERRACPEPGRRAEP